MIREMSFSIYRIEIALRDLDKELSMTIRPGQKVNENTGMELDITVT